MGGCCQSKPVVDELTSLSPQPGQGRPTSHSSHRGSSRNRERTGDRPVTARSTIPAEIPLHNLPPQGAAAQPPHRRGDPSQVLQPGAQQFPPPTSSPYNPSEEARRMSQCDRETRNDPNHPRNRAGNSKAPRARSRTDLRGEATSATRQPPGPNLPQTVAGPPGPSRGARAQVESMSTIVSEQSERSIPSGVIRYQSIGPPAGDVGPTRQSTDTASTSTEMQYDPQARIRSSITRQPISGSSAAQGPLVGGGRPLSTATAFTDIEDEPQQDTIGLARGPSLLYNIPTTTTPALFGSPSGRSGGQSQATSSPQNFSRPFGSRSTPRSENEGSSCSASTDSRRESQGS